MTEESTQKEEVKPKKQKRSSWDELFMNMADQAVERSACIHYPLGSIFVDNDHRIIGFGYSGPSKGDFNCAEAGYCLKVEGDPLTGELKRCNGAHAEMNAIANCADTSRLEGSTLYNTIFPCYDCMKILNNVGVKRIVYRHEYRRMIDGKKGERGEREQEAVDLAAKRGIIIERYDSMDEQKVKHGKLVHTAEEKIIEIKENTKW
jgi:dCMP deaminase